MARKAVKVTKRPKFRKNGLNRDTENVRKHNRFLNGRLQATNQALAAARAAVYQTNEALNSLLIEVCMAYGEGEEKELRIKRPDISADRYKNYYLQTEIDGDCFVLKPRDTAEDIEELLTPVEDENGPEG